MPKTTDLIIAAAQSTSFPGDVARNVAHHLGFCTAAAERGVQFLVFPELSLTGYELTLARSNAVPPDSRVLDPLRRFASDAGMTIVVGAPVPNASGDLYISALSFHPDGSASTYAKEHVHESEAGVFASGPGGPVLRIPDATVALAICRDAAFPQHAATAAERGASLYAVGAMITEDDYPRKAGLLEAYAREHRMTVLLANYSGVTGGDQSAGKSALWAEGGRLIAASWGTEEAIVVGKKQNGVWTGTVLPVAFSAAASQ